MKGSRETGSLSYSSVPQRSRNIAQSLKDRLRHGRLEYSLNQTTHHQSGGILIRRSLSLKGLLRMLATGFC